MLFPYLSYRSLSPSIGFGKPNGPSEEQFKSQNNVFPDPNAWRKAGEEGHFVEPKVDAKSPYPIGKTKPAGSNYTRCLVVPKIGAEDTGWIEEELGDFVDAGLLTTAVYVMNDRTAPLHPIKNKGNEVMAYLSYIIDFYEKLPDIAIFMHSHRYTWHNNLILNKDASLMIRHLSPERVTREGYMNLRCHWEPGCPDWMHPGSPQSTDEKKEEQTLADSWDQLFPRDPIPPVLAQPCCAQFALSRERITAIPKERFVWLRDWILRTELSNYLSGRVFEYIWQYIFTSSPLHCPSMSACYCDGFGLCFGDPEKFDYYFELEFRRKELEKMLKVWEENAEKAKAAREKAKGRKLTGDEAMAVPEFGRDQELKEEMEKIEADMKRRAEAAFELGKDPRQRAKEAGRVWEEGDGF